jgi:hypothetical protein
MMKANKDVENDSREREYVLENKQQERKRRRQLRGMKRAKEEEGENEQRVYARNEQASARCPEPRDQSTNPRG